MLGQLEGIPNHGKHPISFGQRDLRNAMVNLAVLILKAMIFSLSHLAQATKAARGLTMQLQPWSLYWYIFDTGLIGS